VSTIEIQKMISTFIPRGSRYAAANNLSMSVGMNVLGCLVCYNNLSSVAENCPRGWTSKYIHIDAIVRGKQDRPQEIEVHAALDLLGT
jgi:hypothetical protein